MQIGTNGLCARTWNNQLRGSGGQRSRSQEAKIGQTCEHDISEADLATNWHKWSMGQEHEKINFENWVRNSKVKVIGDWTIIWRTGEGINPDPPLLGRLGFPVKHDIDAEPRIEDTHFPTTAMSISQFCPYQNPTGFSASCSGTSERSSATTNRKSTLYICSNTNAFWHNALTDVIYILNTFAVLYCDFKMLVHKQMKCICQQSALQSAQDCK